MKWTYKKRIGGEIRWSVCDHALAQVELLGRIKKTWLEQTDNFGSDHARIGVAIEGGGKAVKTEKRKHTVLVRRKTAVKRERGSRTR